MPGPAPQILVSLAGWRDTLDDRWPGARRRVGSLALVVAIEIAILLALLTLGAGGGGEQITRSVVTTFDARETETPSSEPDPQPASETAQAPTASPSRPPIPVDASPDRATPPLVPPPPVILQTPRPAPVAAPPTPAAPGKPKITAVIRSDRAGPPTPANTGIPGDSERIAGSGPNGEPLYRARWYREPYPDELRGYLSTTPAPAWALINCQTQPEYRVDHCVLVDEYPQGSNMGSAVLNAAWQFKVRPPRVGGRAMVGEWVRIRIDYTHLPG
ncbi:hypothetical protein [Qipengyuania sp.]|uniref:hypothetical protein n=1 Tax=Qipengyuania sp. TaxID=2004515 RepID=UPI0035C8745D